MARADVRDRRGSGERGAEPHGRCLGQTVGGISGNACGNWWRSKRCLTVRSQHTRSRGSDGERGLEAIEAGTTMRYWIHVGQSRYYRAHLEQDLFGEWTLVCVWGALGTAHGGYSSTGVTSHEEGLHRLDAIDKLRAQHGYLPVEALADLPTPPKREKPFPHPGRRHHSNPTQLELDLGT
jgi:hypothetical protein